VAGAGFRLDRKGARRQVAMFIDRHRIADIDPAVRHQLQLEAEHGIRDVSGSMPIGHWVEDGTIYCLIDAPDEDACCQHHRDRGLSCDELHRLDGISLSRPLSGRDRLAIMAAIKHLWHVPVGQPGQASRSAQDR
jgi:uncharacterized protein DUF4242